MKARPLRLGRPLTRNQAILLGSDPTPPVGWLGDSIPASLGSQDTALVTALYVYSPATWLQMLMFNRIRTSKDLVFATAGHTTANSLARVREVIASGVKVVIVNSITNDIGLIPFEQSIANLRAIWKALTDAGIIVIQIGLLSRSFSTQANLDAMYRLIRWFRQERLAGRPNLYIVDPNAEWADPLSATGAPKTYYAYDTPNPLHPRGLGNYFYCKPLLPIMNRLFPSLGDTNLLSVADLWSADNPTGNLLPNGVFNNATSGTNGGGGATITGTMPAGTTIASVAGTGGTITSLTAGCSLVTMGNGRPGLQIAIGGSGTGSSASPGSAITVKQTIASPGTKFSIGDVLEGGADRIEIDAGSQNLAGVRARLRTTEGGLTYDTYAAWDTIADLLPPEAAAWGLLTPRRTLTAVPTLAELTLWISLRNQTANFGGTIRMSDMFTWKVQS